MTAVVETQQSVENPLLDAWKAVHGDSSFRWMGRRLSFTHTERTRATSLWSFAVPTDQALGVVAEAGPVVEVGAGTGYWARLLRDRGVDVLAYDELGESYRHWFPGVEPWTEVQAADASIAAAHPDRTLLVIWPPMSTMAANAFTAYRDAGGKRFVYVGEGEGGCTATSDLWEALRLSDWHERASVEIPQWDGINDFLWVYERPTGKALGLDPRRLP